MNQQNSFDWRLLGYIALAVAMLGSTMVAALSWVHVKTYKVLTIEVTGSAKKRIVSDLIEWRASITTEAIDRTDAYQSLQKQVETTLAYLKSQNIKDEEIRVSSISTYERFDTEVIGSGMDRIEKETFRGFEMTQNIMITSKRVPEIERVSREITQLIESGVSIISNPPSYYYTELGQLKIEMLSEASKDARMRAENILEAAGTTKIGKLQKADMGVINVNPANSTATSWSGNNDTSSFEKDVITIVHCTFEIEE